MPTPRHDLQTVAVDGKIYAISGAGYLTVDAVEIYEVGTYTWTQGPPIPTKRGWAGADLLGNKRQRYRLQRSHRGIRYRGRHLVLEYAAARQVRLAGCRRGGRAHLRNGRRLQTKRRKAGVQVV